DDEARAREAVLRHERDDVAPSTGTVRRAELDPPGRRARFADCAADTPGGLDEPHLLARDLSHVVGEPLMSAAEPRDPRADRGLRTSDAVDDSLHRRPR